MNEDVVTFQTNDLYSKFGFNDGDILNSLLDYYNSEFFVRNGKVYDGGQALIKVVKFFIVPFINKKIKVYEVVSYHNPVRAEYTIKGFYDDGHLEPSHISVKKDDIYTLLYGNVFSKLLLRLRFIIKRIKGKY